MCFAFSVFLISLFRFLSFFLPFSIYVNFWTKRNIEKAKTFSLHMHPFWRKKIIPVKDSKKSCDKCVLKHFFPLPEYAIFQENFIAEWFSIRYTIKWFNTYTHCFVWQHIHLYVFCVFAFTFAFAWTKTSSILFIVKLLLSSTPSIICSVFIYVRNNMYVLVLVLVLCAYGRS